MRAYVAALATRLRSAVDGDAMAEPGDLTSIHLLANPKGRFELSRRRSRLLG